MIRADSQTRSAIADRARLTPQNEAAALNARAYELYGKVQHYTNDEKFKLLKTLWVDPNSGNVPSDLKTIATTIRGGARPGGEPSQSTIDRLKAIRVEVTRLLVSDMGITTPQLDQEFKELFDSQARKTGDDSALASFIAINVRAHEKSEQARSNLVFSFLHLVSLKIKAPVVTNITAMLATHASAKKDAADAVGVAKKKVGGQINEAALLSATKAKQKSEKIDKAMIRHAQLVQMTAHVHRRLDYLTSKGDSSDPDQTKSSYLCGDAMRAMPAAVRSQWGWSNLNTRMQNYIKHTADIEGEHFHTLLSLHRSDLPALLGSFRVYSRLSPEVQDKVVYQRQLWNIQNGTNSTSAAANRETLGVETSYVNKHSAFKGEKLPPVLEPGNQVAVAMRTPLITNSGTVRNVVVLSCVAPALDSFEQPDFDIYVNANEDNEGIPHHRLKQEAYLDAFNAIAEQVMQCSNDNPQCKRVVIPAVGLNSFLSALMSGQKEIAIGIGQKVLAKLVTDLRASGKEVVFTDDKNPSPRMDGINEILGSPPLTLAGAIPGDWIKDDDLLVNAWDPHSLVGNKLAKDNSIDGYIGRNSLLHFMHGLHCAAHAEGVKLISDKTAA